MQSTGRQEFWTISENLSSKRLGLEVYWAEGNPDSIEIRIGSDNWNHQYPCQIVKMLFVRQKNHEEPSDYPNRTIWKDKSMILLDTAGTVWKTNKGYGWNEKCIKIHEKCIDI